jgi:ferredoxin-NADP reductase
MTRIVDRFLNLFTMYRLTLYFLAALLGLATILSAVGVVAGGPLAVISTAAILLASCFLVNWLFALVMRIRSNPESSLITALIMALIMGPVPFDLRQLGILALAGAVAVASKYLLAMRRQHVFNPAAAGALFSAFAFGANASWWVGNAALLPLAVVGGLLLARKIGRLRLVAAFLGLFVAFNLVLAFSQGLAISDAFQSVVFVFGHTSLVFFATVMFTEPMTSPKRLRWQLIYAAMVAFLYQPQLSLFGQNLTPEETLMVGNLFSFIISPSFKLRLRLKERRQIGAGIISFTFQRPPGFSHELGQYMEWTLHGGRRYFSLASSPTEPELMIAARFSEKASRYKQEMAGMKPGDLITAGELGGDFVLPKDPRVPLAFIAGGIGITPFRSMIKFVLDKGERRDIVLLYSSSTEEELIFRDLFDEARRQVGVKVVYTLTDTCRIRQGWCGQRGPIDAPMVRKEVPAFMERRYFVSGPPGMVNAMLRTLHAAGVPRRQVRTDAFQGY